MLNVGLLAYGVSGRVFHAPLIAHCPGLRLYGAVERDAKKKRIQTDYGSTVVSFDSVEELLQDKKVDIVVVNTPSGTHFQFGQQVLKALKHVVIEKPVAVTCAEVATLFRLAGEVGRHIFPFHQMRWSSDFLTFKKIRQHLEPLVEFHSRWDRFNLGSNPKQWKEDSTSPSSGLLYDLGPHLLDQAFCLFGESHVLEKVHKTTSVLRPNSLVTDYFHLHLEFRVKLKRPEEVSHVLHVFLSGSLLAYRGAITDGLVVHGQSGSFRKERGDRQEEQLRKGEAFTPQEELGVERTESRGKLYHMDKEEDVVPERGSWISFYDEVQRYLSQNSTDPFCIDEKAVLRVTEVLEHPDGCWEPEIF